VPPPPEELLQCLGDLERFLHANGFPLPVLVKAALIHVQFESIHPFLDGNGRLGRLLITFLLYTAGVLREPALYLSLYLKRNRQRYYELLQEVRLTGNWEAWVEFFSVLKKRLIKPLKLLGALLLCSTVIGQRLRT
jgi:Fic family protein